MSRISPATPGAGAGTVTPPAGADAQRLREAAAALDGLFVRQMVAAMRATVPSDSLTNGGAGEEMFTALLDEHFADALPTQWSRGITDALLGRLGPAADRPPLDAETR
jgi:Rod binding domain-containing protein